MTDVKIPKSRMNISLDYRILTVVLTLVIISMLAIWRPWASNASNTRTIEVTGEAKLSAEPDEFVFYPTYTVTDVDKQLALNELTKKSEDIISNLKVLGVGDNKIKADTSGYGETDIYSIYPEKPQDPVYTLQLTVTVGSRDIAQKVQDYLATTTPSGAVSPQANFSDAKRKELEAKARDEATKEARAKADQSAKNLGFKVGKVKSIKDGAGFGEIITMEGRGVSDSSNSSEPKLGVQPGENELRYSVSVVYFIK